MAKGRISDMPIVGQWTKCYHEGGDENNVPSSICPFYIT